MKLHRLLPACLLVFVASQAFSKSADKEAIERAQSVFDKIEADSESWPHISCTIENAAQGDSEHHMWVGEGGKFTLIERHTSEGSVGAVSRYFIEDGELLVLARTELEKAPDSSRRVRVIRYYFAGPAVSQIWEKAGRFAAGEKIDISALKAKIIPLEERAGLYDLQKNSQQEADQIRGLLSPVSILGDREAMAAKHDGPGAAEPQSSPAAPPYPSGDGWRLISGTRSHDDHFALAWGVQGREQPEFETDDEGFQFVGPDTENLANYVVDLRAGYAIGTTTGQHCSDKARNSAAEIHTEAAWSNDGENLWVAQLSHGRWETMEAALYEVIDGNSISKGVDFLKTAGKAALDTVAGGKVLKKYPAKDFVITLHDVRIVTQGVKTVLIAGVMGAIPQGDADASFDCSVTFAIASGGGGKAPRLTLIETMPHLE